MWVFLGENPSFQINFSEFMICGFELHWEQSLSKSQVLTDKHSSWVKAHIGTDFSLREKENITVV